MNVQAIARSAALALSCGTLHAAPFQATAAQELVPGVLVDRESGRVYLMSPGDKVVALGLADGARVWSSTAAAKPLSLTDGALVCQAPSAEDAANTLELVSLDVGQEGARLAASRVVLPEKVVARIDDSPEHRFRARGTAIQDDAFVAWMHESIPLSGTRPHGRPDPGAPAVRDAQPEETTGTVRFAARSGDAAEVPTADVPPAVRSARPRTPEDAAATAPDAFERTSSDGRHKLTSKRVADDSVWEHYEWTVVEVESGDEVGKVKTHLSQAPFLVNGTTILFETGPYVRREGSALDEQPKSVRAYDLANGEQLWSEPMRDTTYRGSFPP